MPRTGMTGVRLRSSGFITSADRPKTRELTYNLTLAEGLLFLDAEWKTKTVATLCWQLFSAI